MKEGQYFLVNNKAIENIENIYFNASFSFFECAWIYIKINLNYQVKGISSQAALSEV